MQNETLPYLKEMIDLNEIQKNRFHLIIAPCGSGKTTAAMEKLATLASERNRVIFLIDTSAGKSALLSRKDTKAATREWLRDMEQYAEWWGEAHCGNGVRVMTYHQFGKTIQDQGLGWLNSVEVIICDEIHDLSKYIDIDSSKGEAATKYCLTAYKTLIYLKEKYVIAMTATPSRILKRLSNDGVRGKKENYWGKVHEYTERETRYFSSLDALFNDLACGGKILIYTRHVKHLKKISETLWWYNTLPLWSIWNEEIPMSEEQIKARDDLIKKEYLPKGCECLCINAAYETGLNVRDDELQTVIVNDSSYDTIVQVRGRVRHDIDTLYLVDRTLEHLGSYIPDKYLSKKLFAEDKREIIDHLSLELGGEKIGTVKLTSLLREQKCIVQEKKERSGPNKDKWYIILKRPEIENSVPA